MNAKGILQALLSSDHAKEMIVSKTRELRDTTTFLRREIQMPDLCVYPELATSDGTLILAGQFFPLLDARRRCGTQILCRVAPHIVASFHRLMCQREDPKD
jgi:hypothetical protein